jgi:hypothetical protein
MLELKRDFVRHSAATIAGFALSPLTPLALPRPAPRSPTYALPSATTTTIRVQNGETMTTGEVMTYAYDQIGHARTELEQPPELRT